jgi:hypothetical protein
MVVPKTNSRKWGEGEVSGNDKSLNLCLCIHLEIVEEQIWLFIKVIIGIGLNINIVLKVHHSFTKSEPKHSKEIT